MDLFRLTRRRFLAAISAISATVLFPYRRSISSRNELVGDWSVVDYACDGKPALSTAQDAKVSITPEVFTVQLQMPGMPEYTESSRYELRPSALEVDIRNKDDSATFQGVYALDGNRLTMAWDTIGKGRPSHIGEPDRFGLNRMILVRT